jgi:hypothetical protein
MENDFGWTSIATPPCGPVVAAPDITTPEADPDVAPETDPDLDDLDVI